jgi:hypothetical protein
VPDGATKKALDAGVSEAKALFAARYGAGFLAFFEGTHWMAPTLSEVIEGQSTDYADPNKYAVDGRVLPSSGLASSIDMSPGHTYAPKQSSQGT